MGVSSQKIAQYTKIKNNLYPKKYAVAACIYITAWLKASNYFRHWSIFYMMMSKIFLPFLLMNFWFVPAISRTIDLPDLCREAIFERDICAVLYSEENCNTEEWSPKTLRYLLILYVSDQ